MLDSTTRKSSNDPSGIGKLKIAPELSTETSDSEGSASRKSSIDLSSSCRLLKEEGKMFLSRLCGIDSSIQNGDCAIIAPERKKANSAANKDLMFMLVICKKSPIPGLFCLSQISFKDRQGRIFLRTIPYHLCSRYYPHSGL